MPKSQLPESKLTRQVLAWLSSMPAFLFEPPAEGQPRVAPSEFRLFRYGVNATEKGDFLFDEEAARLVMAAYAEHGVPLMGDYEHQSLQQPPMEAPASMTAFAPEVRTNAEGFPELWAVAVQWTDRARAYLESGEYRMFSPAFTFDKDTRRITKLINVALTNQPATHNLEPLVAASDAPGSAEDNADEEEPMECKDCASLAARLKAAEDKVVEMSATNAELTAKLGAFEKTAGDTQAQCSALAGIRDQVLALTGRATVAEALGALTAMKAGNEELVGLKQRLAEEEAARLSIEFTATLSQAVKDGKIAPAQKAFWDGQSQARGAKDGLAMLKSFVETASPKVPIDGDKTKQPTVAMGLSAEQVKLAKLCGKDPKDTASWMQSNPDQVVTA